MSAVRDHSLQRSNCRDDRAALHSGAAADLNFGVKHAGENPQPAAADPSDFPPNYRTVHVSSRDELQRAIREARPATKILIAPGNYDGGLSFEGVVGTPGKPIVVSAADPDKPPVFRGGGSGFHFSKAAQVELHSLVLEGARGNGLNMDDGGAAQHPSHHIVLKNLVIRDVDPGCRSGW
jgi:hypothetical protein